MMSPICSAYKRILGGSWVPVPKPPSWDLHTLWSDGGADNEKVNK